MLTKNERSADTGGEVGKWGNDEFGRQKSQHFFLAINSSTNIVHR
jgi:hypothetical protein